MFLDLVFHLPTCSLTDTCTLMGTLINLFSARLSSFLPNITLTCILIVFQPIVFTATPTVVTLTDFILTNSLSCEVAAAIKHTHLAFVKLLLIK